MHSFLFQSSNISHTFVWTLPYLSWVDFLLPGTWSFPSLPGSWCWLCWRACPWGRNTNRTCLLPSRCGWKPRRWTEDTCWEPCPCLWRPSSPSAVQELLARWDDDRRWRGQTRSPQQTWELQEDKWRKKQFGMSCNSKFTHIYILNLQRKLKGRQDITWVLQEHQEDGDCSHESHFL